MFNWPLREKNRIPKRKMSEEWIRDTLKRIHRLPFFEEVFYDPHKADHRNGEDRHGTNEHGAGEYSASGGTGQGEIRYSERGEIRYSERGDGYARWQSNIRTMTFQEKLMQLISRRGLSNQEFYTAAMLDRKLFSAIKNNAHYQPKKETAVACCLGLKLSLEESAELLELAGYRLSLAIPWDRVIYYCLQQGITDIDIVNELLYEDGDKCIRSID